MKLSRLIRAKQRVLLVGPPGCAKTARWHEAAAAERRGLVVMRASLLERVDVGQAPVSDAKLGITRCLPLQTLFELQGADCPPTLLFLDDLGHTPIEHSSRVDASVRRRNAIAQRADLRRHEPARGQGGSHFAV